MSISHDRCAPFISATLLQIEGRAAPNLSAIREAIVLQLKKNAKSSTSTRKIYKVHPSIFSHGTVEVAWIHYSEIGPPAWYLGSDLKETRHHVVFLAQKGHVVALTFSDPVVRASTITEIRRRRTVTFGNLKVLTARQINDGFVGG